MEYKRGRFSWLLRPFLISYDLLILNLLAFKYLNFNANSLCFFSVDLFNDRHFLFVVYSLILWLISTFLLKFYKVYRYTSVWNILSLLAKQFLAYLVIVFAFIGFFRSINLQSLVVINYLIYSFLCIGIIKLLSYFVLKSVRFYLKGNLREIVIVGDGPSVLELKSFFFTKKELGYNVKAIFSDLGGSEVSGTINESFDFLKNNKNIDEIYCAIDELSEKQVNDYVKYANLYHCNIKFIPNTLKLYTKRLQTNYYDYLPVLSIREASLNNELNKFSKRVFDVLFSILVIVFVLSWLSIILFIINKFDSKGVLFYKHKRTGINYKEFYCYKFRSLTITEEIKGSYVKQDDNRVTRIGRFLRMTSIDELPQFLNVLKGDMSVVGPRPHMLSYTDDYSKKIDKYNFIYRHHVKPGITGLAQIKGYRGEVETDKDIINRVKYDVFYIENWSILLDFKIIIKTVLNILKGEEKAY